MKSPIKIFTNQASLIDLILVLRVISIIIQISLLSFVQFALEYALPWFPLLTIILIEVAFNLVCFVIPRIKNNTSRSHLFIQLLADVIFLGCLLLFSGGATNAFVSLLLIPIAIAAVCLPVHLLSIVTLCAAATYSYLLYIMPMHEMHGNIEGHFVAMWLNFIFSAAVVSIVISRMAKTISESKLTMNKYREEQLKQEQIIALGVASTQVTHDLATPISSIRMLLEELQDELDEVISVNQSSETSKQPEKTTAIHTLLDTLNTQVSRCSTNLQQFRNITLDIKTNTQKPYSVTALLKQIKQYCHLAYSEHKLNFVTSPCIQQEHAIWADTSLLPALINFIDNAVKHSHEPCAEVTFTASVSNNKLILNITDSGQGFNLNKHSNPIHEANIATDVHNGLGIALLLSNSSIERLKGEISMNNQTQGGAQVKISFPLYFPLYKDDTL